VAPTRAPGLPRRARRRWLSHHGREVGKPRHGRPVGRPLRRTGAGGGAKADGFPRALRSAGSHAVSPRHGLDSVGRAVLARHVTSRVAPTGRRRQGFYQVMRASLHRVASPVVSRRRQISLEETMLRQGSARFASVATSRRVLQDREAATHIEPAAVSATGRSGSRPGPPHTKESAMVKWWARARVETFHQCLLFHGHYATPTSCPSSKRMRTSSGSRSATARRGDERPSSPRADGARADNLLTQSRTATSHQNGEP